ncbi:VanZ family protein [Spirillospora sp. NPDC047279]|uniref:VanZ family protein n=1 Tax=Spirillospora sp. NPDC047279 TaxID=3155478 RepID=UPI0033DFD8F9
MTLPFDLAVLPDVSRHLPMQAVYALTLWVVLAGAMVLAWRPLTRRTGWAPRPTLALLVWTGLVLALTLPTTVEPGTGARLANCLADPAAGASGMVRTFGARGVEDVMNVVLWVPCGLFAVLATRRAVAAPAAVAGGFVVVEFVQTLDPGRWCDPGDWAFNSFGVAVGAVAAAAFLRLRRRGNVRLT